MKKIICELCESTNLIKQNGIFVCQDCGMKYSLEEAKKMMVEVEDIAELHISSTAPVLENNPQVQNLLELARVSLSSNNYSETEKFCNQVIAIDAQNYEAWKIKGDAIASQNSPETPRILEVYNCYITAYRALCQEEKDTHKREIADGITNSLTQHILLWLQEVENKRPTFSQVKMAKDAFADSYSQLVNAYNELNITDGKESELNRFENTFIMAVNTLCVNAWKSTVGYNYYRQDLDTLGMNWMRPYDFSTSFRPMQEVFETFLDETANLVDLLKYAENQFNSDTDDQTKVNVYNNIAYLVRAPKNSCSYKAMVHTTTNGYGAVVERAEYWEVDNVLTESANLLREEEAETYDKKAEPLEMLIKQEAKDRYWAAHAKEKEGLEKELRDLNAELEGYNHELDADSRNVKINDMEEEISRLNAQWMNYGLFKGKEKRALLQEIEKKKDELAFAKRGKAEAEEKLNPLIDKLKSRIEAIEEELYKDR